MLDIIVLIFYARFLARRAFSKGYPRIFGLGLAAGLWIGLEIAAFSVGLTIIGEDNLQVLLEAPGALTLLGLALGGIGLAIVISFLVISLIPFRRQKVLTGLDSRQINDKDRCLYVSGLARLKREGLDDLIQLYERELHWPTSQDYQICLVKSISKAGGDDYLKEIQNQ